MPKDWRYVRIYPQRMDDDNIFLRVQKLLGEEINAQAKTVDKANKPEPPKTRPVSSH